MLTLSALSAKEGLMGILLLLLKYREGCSEEAVVARGQFGSQILAVSRIQIDPKTMSPLPFQ